VQLLCAPERGEDAGRPYRVAALVATLALTLDFARVAIWRAVVGRAFSPGLLLFSKLMQLVPWLLYAWLLIWLSGRRTWLASPSPRFFAAHGGLASAMIARFERSSLKLSSIEVPSQPEAGEIPRHGSRPCISSSDGPRRAAPLPRTG